MKSLLESILDSGFDLDMPSFDFPGIKELCDILKKANFSRNHTGSGQGPEWSHSVKDMAKKLGRWLKKYYKDCGEDDKYFAAYYLYTKQIYFATEGRLPGLTELVGFDDDRCWYLDACYFAHSAGRGQKYFGIPKEVFEFFKWLLKIK